MFNLTIPNQKCSKIIFSDRSFLGIVAETYERSKTETGGILLGDIIGDTWYVLESLDPGPNSIFQQSYFEYDTPYVTHLANKIARFYQVKLQLLGLWHRHPGSFDSFSSTDDSTNREYALKNSAGAISGLVNLDPSFRLTMYHVFCSHNSHSRPQYRKISSIEVGDSKIPSDLLLSKKPEDYFPRKSINKTRQPEYQRSNDTVKSFKLSPSNLGRQVSTESLSREVSVNNFSEDQSNSEVEQFLDIILTTIEPELNYLENQDDYNYYIRRQENQIQIEMKYVGNLPGYPRSLQWTFYFLENNYLVTQLNHDQRFEYQPNIIEECIKKLIERACSR